MDAADRWIQQATRKHRQPAKPDKPARKYRGPTVGDVPCYQKCICGQPASAWYLDTLVCQICLRHLDGAPGGPYERLRELRARPGYAMDTLVWNAFMGREAAPFEV
jgi:hypothetical protein